MEENKDLSWTDTDGLRDGRRKVSRNVLVLGAGIMGMSTAVCVQELGPDVHVTIMAEAFSPNTTSDAAGGIWSPYLLGDTDLDMIRTVSKATYRHLLDLAFSADASITGVQQLSGYRLHNYDLELDEDYEWKDVVENCRKLNKEELQRFPIAKSGYFLTTLQVEVSKYLSWLMNRFNVKGGNLVQRKVHHLSEVSCGWDVVVNCCGVGARELVCDTDLEPVRGQLLRVEAPWVKHFYMFMQRQGPDFSYVIPSSNYVTLGGTLERSDKTDVVEEEREFLWQSAICHLPRLKGARQLSSWVGLRPVRSKIRIETDVMECSGRTIQIVHNYGHGGSGITTHWGCALKAKQLVSKLLVK